MESKGNGMAGERMFRMTRSNADAHEDVCVERARAGVVEAERVDGLEVCWERVDNLHRRIALSRPTGSPLLQQPAQKDAAMPEYHETRGRAKERWS